MSVAIRLIPETVRELAFGSIGVAYAGIGTALDRPIRILFVQNLTDTLLMFSLDGVNDHFPLDTNGFLLLDVTANKTIDTGCFIAEGTRIYVQEVVSPTTGSVYVSAFHGGN